MQSTPSAKVAHRKCTWYQGASFTFFIAVAPLFILTAVLAILIVYYRVPSGSTTAVENGKELNNSAFYVNLNSTLLLLITTCMTSLCPLVAGACVGLAAAPILQSFIEVTRLRQRDSLISANELVIAIEMITGALWTGLGDVFSELRRMKTGTKLSKTLKSLTFVVFLTLVLGLLMNVADSWLHIATKTVLVSLLSPVSVQNAQYGVSALPSCLKTNNSYAALDEHNVSCTLVSNLSPPALCNETETALVLNNLSSSLAVLSYDKYNYLGMVAPNSTYDFTATTIAIQATCQPISKSCNLTNNGLTSFHCPGDTFTSDAVSLDQISLHTHPFRSSDMPDFRAYYGVENPFFYAAATQNFASSDLTAAIFRDAEITSSGNLISAIFLCQISVFDAEYEMARGQIRRFSLNMSSIGTANMINTAVAETSWGQSKMKADMDVAGTLAGSAQEYADAFAVTLARTLLSSGAGSVEKIPALAVQARKSIIITKVPIGPLTFLVGVNMGLVLLGIILGVLAVSATDEAKQARKHLTVNGLVAEFLESKGFVGSRTMLEEYTAFGDEAKIGVTGDRTGGFCFDVIGDGSKIEAQSEALSEQHIEEHTAVRFPSLYGPWIGGLWNLG